MKHILIILSILFCTTTYGQDYKTLVNKADALYNSSAYAESTQTYKEAFKIEQKSYSDLYNAACSASLAGDTKLALEWLEKSIDYGWTNISHLKIDTDLNALHDLKEWPILLEKLQKMLDVIERNYDKPLQQELLKINEDDQKYRMQLDEVEKKYGYNSPQMQEIWQIIGEKDSINLVKVKSILDKHGWVGPDKVGKAANQTLFLVIQHSDLATQQHYLPMMREAVKTGNASGGSLALLEDRVALGEGRKQVYGSQIGRDNASGKYFVSPLEDPDNVDKRRAEVGLPPLAQYVQRWEIVWDVVQYKKDLAEKEGLLKKM